MRKDYVVGFAFSADRSQVVLIEKKVPAWQAGKLNGPGGKIEPGETPIDAMCREFAEETGVTTAPADWNYFCHMEGRDGDVHFYSMFDDKALAAKTCQDETVLVIPLSLDAIRARSLSNLPWLLGIALDENQPIFFVKASYQQEFATGNKVTAKVA